MSGNPVGVTAFIKLRSVRDNASQNSQ